MAPAQRRKSLSQRLGISPGDLDTIIPVPRAHGLMAYLYDTFPNTYWDSDDLTTLAMGICMLAKDLQVAERMRAMAPSDDAHFMETLPMLGELIEYHQHVRELWAPVLDIDCDRDHDSRRERLRGFIQEHLNGYSSPDTILMEGVDLVRRSEIRPRLALT